MKKSIFIIAFLCIISATLIGCGKQQNTELDTSQTQESTQVVEESVSMQETEEVEEDETEKIDAVDMLYEDFSHENSAVTIIYPQFSDEKYANVNEIIKNFAKNIPIDIYCEDYTDLELELAYEVTYNQEGFLSIVFKGDGYVKTAAHPNNLFETLTIDLEKNEVLCFADLYEPTEELRVLYAQNYNEQFIPKKFAEWGITEEDPEYEEYMERFSSYQAVCFEEQCFYDATAFYITPTGVCISTPESFAVGDHFETEATFEQLQPYLKREDSFHNQQTKLFEEQMHKIWIVPEEPKDVYQNFSYVITKMENDYIEGQYCVRFKPVNPESERTVIFTGTNNGKTAECQLWIDGKNAGTMTLSMNSEDKMKADISYEYDDYVLNDELIFEPYRISDVVNYFMEEEAIATMETEKWGKVKIVVGRKDSNKSSPIAVMVNEENEILYEFDASYKSGTVIEEVNIVDGNGDGLQDVEIVTYFFDNDGVATDMEPLRWPFYQDAEGTFYLKGEEVVMSFEPIF